VVPRQCPLVLLVEVMNMIGINFVWRWKGWIIVKFWSNIGRATLGRKFVTIGRAACEACSVTWNLGINSAFSLGPRKTRENWSTWPVAEHSGSKLTSSQSPTLTLIHIWLLFYLKKNKFTYLFLDIFLFMCILWMSTKQLCITFAKRVHAYTHIHAYKHTYIHSYICDYLSTGEFEYLLWWWWGVSYCDMTPKSRNTEVRRDVHCYATTR
jgi:hypothetical protein